MPQVKFVNEKLTVDAVDGDSIRTIARKNGIPLCDSLDRLVDLPGIGECVVVSKGSENCSRVGIVESMLKWVYPLLGIKILSHDGKDVRVAGRTAVHGDIEVETRPAINWHGEKFWG